LHGKDEKDEMEKEEQEEAEEKKAAGWFQIFCIFIPKIGGNDPN